MNSPSYRIHPSESVQVHEDRRNVMLSLDDRFADQITQSAPGSSGTVDLSKYGFYTFVEEKTIWTSPGEIRWVPSEIFDGPWPYFYATLTPFYSLSNLTPGTSGVLYIEIPSGNGSIEIVSAIAGFDTDGDGAFDQYMEFRLAGYRLLSFSSDFGFNQSESILRYAGSFVESTSYIRKKIADVTVDSDGYPSVEQVHIGVIHVTVGTGYTPSVSVAYA